MTSVPLLSGIAATEQAEYATRYPLNLEPVAVDNKLSKGQLRATSGAIQIGTGPGIDRGAVTWNNQHYRVMGGDLVRVEQDGTATSIGTIGGADYVSLDYGFDRLTIASNLQLWYSDGASVTQVTDPDLGLVLDAMWIDGYTMTTDGTYVIVTELSDPTSVLPLKYGSAEEDPDMVTGLMKLRDQPYIIGRNTIQLFQNVGGNGFPFITVEGATIPYGCVSPSAKCYFANSFAFVGGGRDEALGVRIAGQADASKISTRAVDEALARVTDPTSIIMESRFYKDEQRLFVHLPEESWVFLGNATAKVQEEVWYRVKSGDAEYRIRNAIPAYGKFIVGDTQSSAIGVISDDVSTHFGEEPGWSFDAGLLEGPGILHSVQLIGLQGRGPPGEESRIFFSMTKDGTTYSAESVVSAGKAGDRRLQLQWRPHTRFLTMLGMRWRGTGPAMPGFAKIDAKVEDLFA